ncbi:MAG: hypothetical protein WCG61_05125 [Chlorobium sp.]
MIEKSELIGIIESAFLPLECVAQLKEYQTYAGFTVTLPDGTRLMNEELEPDLKTDLLVDARHLTSVITLVRERIGHKGITLDEWSLPHES